MLYDRAKIEVRAGGGGDGCTSFRREAHVPRGGPDGGDGGRGGSVVLVCDDSLRDLQSFKRKPHYRAERGGHGKGALRHGADGEQLIVRVPPGTQVQGVSDDLGGRSWDLSEPGQRAHVARGGPGGRGNKRFATATRQAPRFAERGLSGEQGWLQLQLKLLADVGLVGLPNAGKSSLLARLTRAAPKVANYPFTTLSPVLGVLEGEERALVIADIPGLIEGASEGAGLGHDFLAHVERTRLLVHVLDIAPEAAGGGQAADPAVNFQIIEGELAAYDKRLPRLPRVLALSKADLLVPEQVDERVAWWSRKLGGEVPVIATSSATGVGIERLAAELLGSVPASPVRAELTDTPEPGSEHLAEHIVFRPGPQSGFQVHRTGPRSFAVDGRGVERLVARYDVENEDAMAYLEGRLRKIGVLSALEAEGFQAGDELQIAGVAFELDPDATA